MSTSFLSSICVVNVGVPLGFDVLVKLIPEDFSSEFVFSLIKLNRPMGS